MIPEWCTDIISQVDDDFSLEKRIVLVDSYLISDNDNTEFVNESEYVIRLNPEVCIRSGMNGYKTDILLLLKDNFSPYSRHNYKNNYASFYKKVAFKESHEIWLHPRDFVGSEGYDIDLLNFHVKHLYSHYKDSIKMLSLEEYYLLIDRIGTGLCDVSSLAMEMMVLDTRFHDYEMFLSSSDISQEYMNDVFDQRITVM